MWQIDNLLLPNCRNFRGKNKHSAKSGKIAIPISGENRIYGSIFALFPKTISRIAAVVQKFI